MTARAGLPEASKLPGKAKDWRNEDAAEVLRTAEDLTIRIDRLIGAHISRFVHMSTTDKPLDEARQALADLLAETLK